MTMHSPATRADLVVPFLASFVSRFVALVAALVGSLACLGMPVATGNESTESSFGAECL